MNCVTGTCHQGRRTCTTPTLCGSVFHQHEGLAVVNKGQGLHMPTEAEDVPIIDAEGAQFYALMAFFVVLFVLACIGLATLVHFVLRISV